VRIAVFLLALPLAAAELNVASPDGRVQFQLSSPAPGRLQYTVTFAGKPAIEASPVGIVVDGVNLADGVAAGQPERYEVNESYAWYGPHSTAVNRANGVKLALTHTKSHTAYTLEVRVANDGVAFRQIVPGESKRVPDEAAGFRLPAGTTVWYHDLNDHYEGAHVRKNIASLPPGQWVAPPLTFKLPGGAGYGAITEGNLVQYSGMVLQFDGTGGFDARLGHAAPASWPFRLRYKEDVERLARPAAIAGAIVTPWRIVMLGADLNTLVNSDLVHNVAPPPDPKLFPAGIKTDWIKPGRALWSYLDGGNNTLEGMKEYARLAHELGFEYNVLEGFWSRWPEAQLKELADYSREQGVKILIWTSRKSIQDPEKMRAFFELCNRTGVAGAKIDFFDHENKEIVDLYERLLRSAAEHHLILDFHGANKPTGLERTYPNLLGHEGIRGMENSNQAWSQHDTTLPFTRLLAGLADYTPVHFGRRLRDTTWAHQVANAVILQAPMLCYAAHPANMLANPTADVLKSIPSVWDETIVLPPSEIGDVAVFARRRGDMWFVAVTNGIDAKTIKLDLSFLKGNYRATLLRDTGEAAAVKIENVTVAAADSLFLNLRSGGGFVARFMK
jgi:alpha-glucosidase